MIIGAVIGAVIGYAIVASLTDGPKFPGDKKYSGNGPGCLKSIGIVGIIALVGAGLGALLGLG